MIAYDPFAAALARWLDTRLSAPKASRAESPAAADPDGATDARAARLFGLVVMDPAGASSGDDGAVRFVAVAEGEAYELVRTVAPLAIHHHEALALVTEGWAAPLPPADGPDGGPDANPPPLVRPSRHPARRRVRVTTVGLESGAVGTALRWLDGDDGAVDPGPVAGPLAEALGQACDMTDATHCAERCVERDRVERDRPSAA